MNGAAVLVGVDGSEPAARAVHWAAHEAALRHVRLTLLTAVGYAGSADHAPADWVAARETAAGELLWTVREDLVTVEPSVGIDIETSALGPEAALRGASAKAGLLVLGEPTGTLSGLLAGSPDLDLAAHAHCPVVVVRGTIRPDGPVVVGVDGSPLSEAAVDWAFEEASLHAVALVAVHTWADTGLPRPSFAPSAQEAERRLLAERLAGRSARYPDVPVEQIVEPDRPRERLLAWSERASLVVLGSRGRGGFTGMVLGSTSHALLHHAGCPVLLVRAGTAPGFTTTEE